MIPDSGTGFPVSLLVKLRLRILPHWNWDSGIRSLEGLRILLACVASVSNRVIARKLERKRKTKRWKREGEGRRGNACPQTPRF